MSQTCCCVPGCSSSVESGVRLHHFPNPKTDIERFHTWIMKIGGDALELENNYIFKNRRVCNHHFNPMFIYTKKLSTMAIPLLHLPGAYMHRFPHPDRRPGLFTTWMTIVGAKLNVSDPLRIYKSKLVCDYHFKTEDKVACHRLMISAIPSLNLNGIYSVPGILVQLEHNYCVPRMYKTEKPRFVHQNNILSANHSSNESDKGTSQAQNQTKPKALPTSTDNKSAPLHSNITEEDNVDDDLLVNDHSHLSNPEGVDTCEDEPQKSPLGPGSLNEEQIEGVLPEEKQFSWQKLNEAVALHDDEPIDVPDNVSLYCDEEDTSDRPPHHLAKPKPTLHEGFQCNACNGEIHGYRYTCVQCNDLDLCSACEGGGAHPHHYMLRVPTPVPHSEVQAVLVSIRNLLMMEKDPICGDDDAVSIKSEVKSETELEEECFALTPDPAADPAPAPATNPLSDSEPLDSDSDSEHTIQSDGNTDTSLVTSPKDGERLKAKNFEISSVVVDKQVNISVIPNDEPDLWTALETEAIDTNTQFTDEAVLNNNVTVTADDLNNTMGTRERQLMTAIASRLKAKYGIGTTCHRTENVLPPPLTPIVANRNRSEKTMVAAPKPPMVYTNVTSGMKRILIPMSKYKEFQTNLPAGAKKIRLVADTRSRTQAETSSVHLLGDTRSRTQAETSTVHMLGDTRSRTQAGTSSVHMLGDTRSRTQAETSSVHMLGDTRSRTQAETSSVYLLGDTRNRTQAETSTINLKKASGNQQSCFKNVPRVQLTRLPPEIMLYKPGQTVLLDVRPPRELNSAQGKS